LHPLKTLDVLGSNGSLDPRKITDVKLEHPEKASVPIDVT